MNPSRSKFCEGSDVHADDPLPIHLRRYTMWSSKDPAGWNVGIIGGEFGEASVSAGGIFHTAILMVCMLPPIEPNRLYYTVVCVRNKSYCRFTATLTRDKFEAKTLSGGKFWLKIFPFYWNDWYALWSDDVLRDCLIVHLLVPYHHHNFQLVLDSGSM